MVMGNSFEGGGKLGKICGGRKLSKSDCEVKSNLVIENEHYKD